MRKMEGFTHGINLGGWLSQCRRMTEEHLNSFITRMDIESIARMGFDHVRLPVDYNAIETEDGQSIESGLGHVDDCVRWCRENGLHLLLDLHKAYGYTFDPSQKDADREIFFRDAALQTRFIALWQRLAARYGGEETVAFDLLNEVVPLQVAESWNGIADRAIAAIRPTAPNTWILVGGVRYNNVASVPLLRKPADARVVYNFHCYDPMIFSHQNAGWVPNLIGLTTVYPDTPEHYAAIGQERRSGVPALDQITQMGPEFFEALFARAVAHAEVNDAPLYCGEYGVIDQAPVDSALRWLQDINKVFARHGIGRALWTYKRMDFGLIDAHYDGVRDELVRIVTGK